jgi:hypothetical protein
MIDRRGRRRLPRVAMRWTIDELRDSIACSASAKTSLLRRRAAYLNGLTFSFRGGLMAFRINGTPEERAPGEIADEHRRRIRLARNVTDKHRFSPIFGDPRPDFGRPLGESTNR